MAFNDLLAELFKPKQDPQTQQKRGSRVGTLVGGGVLALLVGLTAYNEILAPRYQKPAPEQNNAYAATPPVNLDIPAEQVKAEAPPAKELKSQGVVRKEQPAPKPKVETEEQKYARRARLISHYGGPFGQGWREQADKTNAAPAVTPVAQNGQTLEIPPAQDALALQTPPRCTIVRGSVIPVILENRIDTQTSGQITALVSQDIYDTATGKCVVIPERSQVVGGHATHLADYQRQLPTQWDRLNFPNGQWRDLNHYPGADQSGAGGVPLDKINTHFWSRVGQSALLTLSGATLRTAQSNAYHGGNMDFGDALASQGSIEANLQTRQTWGRSGYQGPTGITNPGKLFLLQVTEDFSVEGDYYKLNGGRSYADAE